MNQSQICDSLTADFSVNTHPSVVAQAIASLVHSGDLIPSGQDEFMIAMTTSDRLANELAAHEENERAVKERFVSTMAKYCPTLDANHAWGRLNALVIAPRVQAMGAKVYTLIRSNGNGSIIDEEFVRELLEEFPADLRADISKGIIEFLDPTVAAIRQFLLSRMTANFCVDACGLHRDSIAKLTLTKGQRAELAIIIDTNFLFSVLDIHDNPANESAARLYTLLTNLSNQVKVKFYVLPETLDEARIVLRQQFERVRGLSISPNIVTVGLQYISGVISRYLREVGAKATAKRAEEYFRPFIDNLVAVVQGKNIEVLRTDSDKLSSSGQFIDDLNSQLAFEQANYGARAKTYEQLKHDLLLWHTTKNRRGPAIDSPIDAKTWTVTIDYRLIGFDRHKIGTKAVPLCIHPVSLVQLLQFWIPRTPELEAAVIDGFRLPFFTQNFDAKSEQITLQILTSLSRFEDSSNLSIETIEKIVVSEAVRSKIANAPDVEREVKIVQEAIALLNEQLRDKLASANANAVVLSQEAMEAKRLLANTQSRLSEIEAQLKDSNERQKILNDAINAKSKAEEDGKRVSRARRELFLWWVVLPIIISVIISLSIYVIVGHTNADASAKAAVISISVLALAWTAILYVAGETKPVIADWALFKFYKRVYWWLFITLLCETIIIAIGVDVLLRLINEP